MGKLINFKKQNTESTSWFLKTQIERGRAGGMEGLKNKRQLSAGYSHFIVCEGTHANASLNACKYACYSVGCMAITFQNKPISNYNNSVSYPVVHSTVNTLGMYI